jgi:Zn-dependent protease with chaperone function
LTEQPLLRRLREISPKAYEHPADRAATAALKAVPMLDTVVRKLIEFQYERAYRQAFLASSVRLGPDQMPQVWAIYEDVLATLDMGEVYDLYLFEAPTLNAATIGAGKPMVVLHSALVATLDEGELRTVLAHEIGHVLSDHVLYNTALQVLLSLSRSARLPLLAGLPLAAVRAALLEWFRAAELSCDRAATLVNRDPLATCRTMMVMAAGAPSERLNLDAFLRQAADYEHWGSSYDKLSRFFMELGLTHDFAVRRTAEVMRWVRSGDYDRIIGGDFPKRGDDVDPGAAAGDAVEYYTERFRTIFRDAGEGLVDAGSKLSDWLRGH